MEYYIYVTNDCNLDCSYCSVLFKDKKFNMPKLINYSLDTLVDFVSNIQKETGDNIADIYFFGGEPTLEYGLITNIILAFSKIVDYKVNFVMHSNGLLIDNAPLDVIRKIDIMLLSINYEKIFTDNQVSPYWTKIINNIMNVRKIKNFPIIGRITVSPNTSLYTECCMMGSFFDYIYWQIDNSPSIPFEKYKKQYKNEIFLLYEYWLNFLRAGVFLRYAPFVSAIRHFLWSKTKPSKFYCGYGVSMIYIQTDGTCYACCDEVESKNHYIGNIKDGVNFPETNLHKLICNNCKYINICGGRCGRMHIDLPSNRINEFCQLNRFMFSLIEDTLPEIQSLILKYPTYVDKFKDPLIAYTEYTS